MNSIVDRDVFLHHIPAIYHYSRVACDHSVFVSGKCFFFFDHLAGAFVPVAVDVGDRIFRRCHKAHGRHQTQRHDKRQDDTQNAFFISFALLNIFEGKIMSVCRHERDTASRFSYTYNVSYLLPYFYYKFTFFLNRHRFFSQRPPHAKKKHPQGG